VVRFKSILGVGANFGSCRNGVSLVSSLSQEDQLLIADPKALHHILNTSENVYSSQPERRVVSGFINGKGVAWTRGTCFFGSIRRLFVMILSCNR